MAKQRGNDEQLQEKSRIQIHADENLPYIYYDMLNVVAGVSEVVLEFGNHLRGSSDEAPKMRVMHRAVLSVPAAFKLQNGLGKGLQLLREKMQEFQEQHRQQIETSSISE